MSTNNSALERIAVLETQNASLKMQMDIQTKDIHEINRKLDDILALRNKGLGAFWLITTLVGIFGIGTMSAFAAWLRG